MKIPDHLDAQLRFEAKRRGLTFSEVTREALERYLAGGKHVRWHGIGSADSGRTDLSTRTDEILREEWPEDLKKEWTREL